VTTVRDTIQRDLADEIQSVIKVAETSRLVVDLREYVLTDLLAKQFGDVLSALVAASRPATMSSGKTGIWVSGFFGSGKSHFAKLIGHLAANTQTDAGPARELFRQRLRPGNARHDRIAELLHEADKDGLKAQLVAFDITALHGDATENTGRIFLRGLYRQLGLSSVIAFADLETEVTLPGKGRSSWPLTAPRREALPGKRTATFLMLAPSSPKRLRRYSRGSRAPKTPFGHRTQPE